MAIILLLVYIYIYIYIYLYIYLFNLFIILSINKYMFIKTRYFFYCVVDSISNFHGTLSQLKFLETSQLQARRDCHWGRSYTFRNNYGSAALPQ